MNVPETDPAPRRFRRLELLVPAPLMERLRHHYERYLRDTPENPVGEHEFVLGILTEAAAVLDAEERAAAARDRLVQPAGTIHVPDWAREASARLQALKGGTR